MSAHCICTPKLDYRLRSRTPRTRISGACWLVGLFAVAMLARQGQHLSFAQQSPSAAVVNAVSDDKAQAATPEQQANQESADAAAGQRKQIADDCANLLKLANGLKADVDKTTKDELSVTVVREAGEIEQLARKMRTR